MKFSVSKESLLIPMQQIVGVVERRQTLAILANVLIRSVGDDRLLFTGTDLEVQVISNASAEITDHGEITVSARKLLDICRSIADGVVLRFDCQPDKVIVQAGKSRFSLAALPAEHYPEFDLTSQFEIAFELRVSLLRRALDKTLFAMGQQDVRYYFNGLMLDLKDGVLIAVATDGHRLALFEQRFSDEDTGGFRQIIVPRKGVLELQRLLAGVPEDDAVVLELASNTIRFTLNDVVFSVKLIDGRFPDYRRVLPQEIKWLLKIDRHEIKAAFTRMSILSTDKFRGVHLNLAPGLLSLNALNPEHEEAFEEIEVEYAGMPLTVGFNISYLLDAINAVDSPDVLFLFPEDAHSCLIQDSEASDFKFIVMPVRF